MIAYLPLTRAEARGLRSGAELDLAGTAATAELLAAHGLTSADDEDAQYTALAYAGLAALGVVDTETPLRLLVAAEVPADRIARGAEAAGLGAIRVSGVRWDAVQSVFADDPASLAALQQARVCAAGRSLTQLVDDVALEAALASADLLWFDPSELDRLG